MLQVIVFWSNREIKMSRNVAYRLNREIKVLRKIHARKISCLKVTRISKNILCICGLFCDTGSPIK